MVTRATRSSSRTAAKATVAKATVAKATVAKAKAPATKRKAAPKKAAAAPKTKKAAAAPKTKKAAAAPKTKKAAAAPKRKATTQPALVVTKSKKIKVEQPKKTAAAAGNDDQDCGLKLPDMAPGGKVYGRWSASLNQTDIKNNANKLYVLALLQFGGSYCVFTRWGRVGEPGAVKTLPASSLEDAKKIFRKKFQDKTRNKWEERHDFQKVPGKYQLIHTKEEEAADGVGSAGGSAAAAVAASGPVAASKLDPASLDFVSFVFNQDMFREQLASQGVDLTRLPLGELSAAQVASAFEVLERIEAEINGKKRSAELSRLSSEYYTVLPHVFGRKVPPVINTAKQLQDEYDLAAMLGDVETAQGLGAKSGKSKGKAGAPRPHPMDEKLESLNLDEFSVVDPKSALFKQIERYAKQSGKNAGWKLNSVFKIARGGEDKRFAKHDALDRSLLWHGTSAAVVAAILKGGLRIMPHSGGRVGRGIYLASEQCKSYGYVRSASWKGKRVGVMLLVEAAHGDMHEILTDDSSLKKAPKGYHSVLAKGTQTPIGNSEESIEIDGRQVRVPAGAIKPTGENSRFHQDEILLYDESQHRARFVLSFSM